MKRFTLAALFGATLLSGCATDGTQASPKEATERGYTALGTFIPRKSAPSENVKTVDRQAFENDRIMNSGTNNSAPAR
jgi:hypothetical protein